MNKTEAKKRVKEVITAMYAMNAPENENDTNTLREALDLLWDYYDELTKSEDEPVHITRDQDSLKIAPNPLGPITIPLTNPWDQVIYTSGDQSGLHNLRATSSESGEKKC